MCMIGTVSCRRCRDRIKVPAVLMPRGLAVFASLFADYDRAVNLKRAKLEESETCCYICIILPLGP